MFDWVLNMPLHHRYDYIFFLLFAKLIEYVYRLHHADVMLTRSWIQNGVSASTRLRNNLNPSVYNSPSVVIHPSVSALVALFLYTLGKHNSSLFSKTEMISDENNSNFICMQKIVWKNAKVPSNKTAQRNSQQSAQRVAQWNYRKMYFSLCYGFAKQSKNKVYIFYWVYKLLMERFH